MNKKISYEVIKPDGTSLGLVILMHGFSSNKNNSTNMYLTPKLISNSVAVIRFDFRGHGSSEGNLRNTTITRGIEDLQQVLNDSIVANPEFENLKLVLFGSSFGATIALASPIKSVGITVKSPVIDIPEMQLINRGEEVLNKWKKDGVILIKGSKKTSELNYSYVSDALNYDIYNIISNKPSPVYIVHGSCDEIAPVSQSRKLLEKANNKVELVEIDGADHRYTKNRDFNQMIELSCHSILKQLNLK